MRASVFSPLMAARATFALKAGAWVRRIRLAIVAPDLRHSHRSQAELPLIDLSEFSQPPLSAHSLALVSLDGLYTPQLTPASLLILCRLRVRQLDLQLWEFLSYLLQNPRLISNPSQLEDPWQAAE